ncbi:MAG: hypothetical protein J4224_00505 [Candidatus Diapherotrites archaeon]|uniref:AbrB/MazE/SpoVT family DNA-binding domain-containing protein n=1 Tax=Candidatus Iainarchaeum sp. TaxID=3101447 RepID=A0A7J4IWT4_9ARCH|nr:MAG: hypothetical protein QT03_C0001G0467 [archaeon GW2011_AR10]MBS3058889.1 hypothetical protein [Candidatus Diapherotrites archaeon]HIH08725.1 hypothetical protein [Candidatus Diapherotrites archaeon]
MIEYEVQLKKWGNSVGLIVPKEALEKESLKPRQMVRAIITPIKTLKVKDIFGKLRLKKPTAQIMAEIDRDFEEKFGK